MPLRISTTTSSMKYMEGTELMTNEHDRIVRLEARFDMLERKTENMATKEDLGAILAAIERQGQEIAKFNTYVNRGVGMVMLLIFLGTIATWVIDKFHLPI